MMLRLRLAYQPTGDVRTMKIRDFKSDVGTFVDQVVGDGCDLTDAQIDELELPVRAVPVDCFPVIDEDCLSEGVDYALAMRPAEQDPVVIADGVILDGRHRIFCARACRMEKLDVVDLSGLVSQKTIMMNGYSMMDLVQEAAPAPSL